MWGGNVPEINHRWMAGDRKWMVFFMNVPVVKGHRKRKMCDTVISSINQPHWTVGSRKGG